MNALGELSEAETYAAEQCATAALLDLEAQYAEPMKARTGQGPYPLQPMKESEMVMKFKATGGGEDFKRCPAGSHLAVCNMVADVGLQPGSRMYPNPKHKIYVRFEVPSERVEYEKDGKKIEGPITIGTYYTASMSEKATLRKHLEGWRSRKFTDTEAEDFDVSAILGKACMLSVVETESDGKTYSNIANIGAVPKGLPPMQAENPLLYYAADDEKQFDKLPEWLQKKIGEQLKATTKEGADDAAAKQYASQHDSFDDQDIPF